MERIVSGLTTTGTLTIGNYLGSIKQLINNGNKREQFLIIADLHGITVPFSPENLTKNSINLASFLIACGLDISTNHIFFQNQIVQHPELSYILVCHTTVGELVRMTQYKEKSEKFKLKNKTNTVPSGVLFYPALMAADILLYDPHFVPVGGDQKQHLELTRNIAMRMNNKYGEIFKIPEFVTQPNLSKIMSLTNPTKKMSKSNEDQNSYISVLDDASTITKKIMRAKTDSENKIYYDVEHKPGISNLITIYSGFSNLTIEEVTKKVASLDYGNFKKQLSKLLVSELIPVQEKFKMISENMEWKKVTQKGQQIASSMAAKKLSFIKSKIGLL